jgi:hypothetical protein
MDSDVPYFPPELERDIFERAALRYPATIPILLRVCHRAHCWQVLRDGASGE